MSGPDLASVAQNGALGASEYSAPVAAVNADRAAAVQNIAGKMSAINAPAQLAQRLTGQVAQPLSSTATLLNAYRNAAAGRGAATAGAESQYQSALKSAIPVIQQQLAAKVPGVQQAALTAALSAFRSQMSEQRAEQAQQAQQQNNAQDLYRTHLLQGMNNESQYAYGPHADLTKTDTNNAALNIIKNSNSYADALKTINDLTNPPAVVPGASASAKAAAAAQQQQALAFKQQYGNADADQIKQYLQLYFSPKDYFALNGLPTSGGQ